MTYSKASVSFDGIPVERLTLRPYDGDKTPEGVERWLVEFFQRTNRETTVIHRRTVIKPEAMYHAFALREHGQQVPWTCVARFTK